MIKFQDKEFTLKPYDLAMVKDWNFPRRILKEYVFNRTKTSDMKSVNAYRKALEVPMIKVRDIEKILETGMLEDDTLITPEQRTEYENLLEVRKQDLEVAQSAFDTDTIAINT